MRPKTPRLPLVRACPSATPTAEHPSEGRLRTALSKPPRHTFFNLTGRADAPFWVYRRVRRSFPDTSGRKPLKNPGPAGAAIGFKSPSSHFQHLIVPLLAD